MALSHGGSPAPDSDGAELKAGLIAAVWAYSLWGVLPLYLHLLGGVPAMEILAHRIVWAVPFAALVLFWRRQWRLTLAAALDRRVLAGLCLTALFIGVNWFVYVWAIANGRTLEASLGYYINPLMSVAVGVVVLGERLRTAQLVAVGLAAAGVAILTVGAGAFPWVSVLLAAAFCAYGFLRKKIVVNAVPGLFLETVILFPPALAFIVWAGIHAGQSHFLSDGPGMTALLVLAGPVTVIPLVLFAIGARRLKLSTMGLLQYIAPTLQFACALYFGETFTVAHGVCFAMIWAALALFSWDAWRAQKPARTIGGAGQAHPAVARACAQPDAQAEPQTRFQPQPGK